MEATPRQKTALDPQVLAWLTAKAPSLIGADLTLSCLHDDSGAYCAKVLAVEDNRIKINLPRRLAGHGYLRESGEVIINFVVDDVLYEALADYRASEDKVRSIDITGEIRQTTRRRFARLPIQIKAGYAAVSEVTLTGGRLATVAWRWSSTRDISGGGILIETPIQVPAGAYLLLNLDIESFQGPVFVFGQVRWSGLSDSGRGLFQCGIMFIAREEMPIHFSPQVLTAIPPIMRQFDRNTRYELDAFLQEQSNGANKGESDVT